MRSPPLGELYDLLRAGGFAIGVDDYLRIGRLLEREAPWTPVLLRTAVAALVVTDPDERNAFDECWMRWMRSFEPSRPPEPLWPSAKTPSAAKRRFPHARAISSAIVAVFVIGIVLVARYRGCGDHSHAPPEGAGSGSVDTAGAVAPPGGGSHKMSDKASSEAGSDTQLVAVGSGSGQTSGAANPGSGHPSSGTMVDITHFTIAIGATLLVFVAIARARVARGRRRFVPGPWRHTLAVPGLGRPMLRLNAIEDAAADLTGQASDSGEEFDLARSIAATVACGGLPTLLHRRPAAAPRYIVLEDIASGARSWQSIYDELLRGLRREGVALERYTFAANPEQCIRPDGHIVALTELVEHADGLIVIGDGSGAVNPLDGRRAGWLETLGHVPRRLWINPLPPVRWSQSAHVIADETPMEHGVARALAALHTGVSRRVQAARPYPAVIERAPETGSAVAALRSALSEPAFQLVAAIAMTAPPTLAAARWLAAELELKLDEQDWLAVATLPWFSVEQWPEGLRERLRMALGVDAPNIAGVVAKLSDDLLAASEPPRNSAAHLTWQLEGAYRAGRGGARSVAEQSLNRLIATPLAQPALRIRSVLGLPDRAGRAQRWMLAIGLVLVLGPISFRVVRTEPSSSEMNSADQKGLRMQHQGALTSAAFSSDGTRAVTASVDKTARVWNAATGKPVTSPLEHQAEVESAVFSPDGTRVATASVDKSARVWDAVTGKPVTIPLEHQAEVVSAAFSPDGTRVITASFDKTARVWNAATGKPVTSPLEHQAEVVSAAFSPDGTRVVTASYDKTGRVWDAVTGKPLTGPLVHQDQVVSAVFSPDGIHIVTASFDKTARVWDAVTGKPTAGPLVHEGQVVSVAFSPDSTRVVTASVDNTARVWDAATGKPLTSALVHQAEVVSAEFSPDGTRVVTASFDKTARVWDVVTGKPITSSLPHQDQVVSARFSPDGTRVITASRDGTARVWDAATGRPLTSHIGYQVAAGSTSLSTNGTRVGTASTDRTESKADDIFGNPPSLASAGSVCPIDMVSVVAGTFWMGSSAGGGGPDERPAHQVTLSAYCIDRTEVTVKSYAACFQAKECTAAREPTSDGLDRFCNGTRADRQDHPINCIDWEQAKAYCKSIARRLPSEAEWEYASRGTDGRTYPWGNQAPSARRLNACGNECAEMAKRDPEVAASGSTTEWGPMYSASDGWETTAPVGSFPEGASSVGAWDMAGNVWEWTADRYGPYLGTAVSNPLGAATGDKCVIRGGAWINHVAGQVRSALRYWYAPQSHSSYVGFRCAKAN